MNNRNQSDCPTHLRPNLIEKFFELPPSKRDDVWEKLQRRETFTKGQIPPYRVEFDALTQTGPFKTGELNIHHGPLLSVHGEIGEISETYRDLKYFYGSYIISFRLVRPTRLEFFKEENGIRLKIHSYINPLFQPIWKLGNDIFWKFFGISFLW